MDADTRKTVLRMIPYGLYVLTTTGEDVGTGTINWAAQMSFDPPLLALGVKKDTRNFSNLKAGAQWPSRSWAAARAPSRPPSSATSRSSLRHS